MEYSYRWFIVVLMALAFLINGLANNAVIPIAHKLSEAYELSDTYVDSPVLASFLVYSLMNFPANHIIDTKGLRLSLLIGTSLYCAGLALFAMINAGYHWVLLGAILVALGQPFVINCPAKVATFWFKSENVCSYLYIEAICNGFDDWAQYYCHRSGNSFAYFIRKIR